jgi:hypothetical protein
MAALLTSASGYPSQRPFACYEPHSRRPVARLEPMPHPVIQTAVFAFQAVIGRGAEIRYVCLTCSMETRHTVRKDG